MKLKLMVVLASAAILSGCYGKFALTKKLYDFNGSLHPNGIVRSVLMVLGSPIYGLAIFADAWIINSVEFWTGSNPVATGNTLEQSDDKGNQVTAIKMPDGSMAMTFRNAYGVETQLTLVREEDMVKALDAQGKVVAQAEVE